MLSVSSEFYLEEGINDFFSKNYEKIKKTLLSLSGHTAKKMEEIEKKLKEHGIDTNKIRRYAEKDTKIQNGKVGKFQTKINEFVREFYTRKFTSNDTVDITGKVFLSLALLAVCFFINSKFQAVAMSFGLSQNKAIMITSIFCAPIIEETTKMISVQKNATGLYFVIFNAAEFLWYFQQQLGMGGVNPLFIAKRLLVVLVHFVLTMIHVDAKEKKTPFQGLGIATLLHMFWNTLGSIGILK